MGFDAKRFVKEKFEPRTESVPVPSLAEWFGEGDKPEWIIRGLAGIEFARVQEAARKSNASADIAKALAAAAGSQEKIDAIMIAAGLPTDIRRTPEDMVRRLEMLVAGSVSPAVDLPLAMQVARAFPVEFNDLTNRIVMLTGQGHVPGKRQPSGSSPE